MAGLSNIFGGGDDFDEEETGATVPGDEAGQPGDEAAHAADPGGSLLGLDPLLHGSDAGHDTPGDDAAG